MLLSSAPLVAPIRRALTRSMCFAVDRVNPFSSELRFCLSLAHQCTQRVHRLRALHADSISVEEKPGGEGLVTSADKELNSFIVSSLRRAFPNDGICAEESDRDEMSAELHKERVWFVDPIDGTHEFVAGTGQYCVMIGLSVGGRPVLGVVHAPAQRCFFYGLRDHGAFVVRRPGDTPKRIRCGRLGGDSSRATLVLSRARLDCPFLGRLREQTGIRRQRICGSLGLKAGVIATGESDLYVNMSGHTSLWDTCAPEAIVSEAGGSIVRFDGRPIDYFGDDNGAGRTDRIIADPYVVVNDQVKASILETVRSIQVASPLLGGPLP